MYKVKYWLLGGTAALALALPTGASATMFNLQDKNTTVAGNDGQGGAGNTFQLSDIVVDGIDHLFNHRWFYRVGNTGGESDDWVVINAKISDADFDTGSETFSAQLRDTGGNFQLDYTLTLTGGELGAGNTLLSENMNVSRLQGGTAGDDNIDLHLFSYNDFDLGGSFDGDKANSTSTTQVKQQGSGAKLEVDNGSAIRWQISNHPDLLDSLLDNSATTLGNTGDGLGGDVEFAFQWTINNFGQGDALSAVQTSVINRVPEPAGLAMLGLGLLGLGAVRRRKAG